MLITGDCVIYLRTDNRQNTLQIIGLTARYKCLDEAVTIWRITQIHHNRNGSGRIINEIIPAITDQRIIALKTGKRVIAITTKEGIVERVTTDRIIKAGPLDNLDINQGINIINTGINCQRSKIGLDAL